MCFTFGFLSLNSEISQNYFEGEFLDDDTTVNTFVNRVKSRGIEVKIQCFSIMCSYLYMADVN